MILFAGVPIMENPNTPSWFHHVDLMQILIASLVVVVTWFISRTLRQIDLNQQELFKKITELADGFHQLKGEHDAIKTLCAQRRSDIL
jgi:sensor histidine kinase YesM